MLKNRNPRIRGTEPEKCVFTKEMDETLTDELFLRSLQDGEREENKLLSGKC